MIQNTNMNLMGTEMWNLINEMVNYKMGTLSTIKSAVIQHVNDDGTVDITIPPTTTVYHKVQNQSIYNLKVGDNVKIIKEGNSLSNIWVVGGFGLTDVRVGKIDVINQSITDEELDTAFKQLIDKVYPVGSVYISMNDTVPSVFFGGEWKEIQGRFLAGADDVGESTAVYMWERIK